MVHAPRVAGVDELVAVWAHTGAAAAAVRSLKYRRATSTVSLLADAMAAVAPAGDLVTWVPSTRGHRRTRGFDPSELLARAVARRLVLPALRLVRRIDSRPQTERDRRGRQAGPVLCPVRRHRRRFGPRVLLVDDVCTTGATLTAAAAALRRGGALSVVAVVATTAVTVEGHERGVRLLR